MMDADDGAIERRMIMNHDATHCADFKKDKCPKRCPLAKLTEELRHIHYDLPVSFAHFGGSKVCPKMKENAYERGD